jgi:hypothetical protein
MGRISLLSKAKQRKLADHEDKMEIRQTKPGPLRYCARRLMSFGAALLAGVALCVSSPAQSLDRQNPAPLKAGANTGTVDNFGGPNYFYFWGGPGEVKITATYKSMSLLGNAVKSNLTVELYAEPKMLARVTISSLKESSVGEMPGTLKRETKLVVAVIPPSGGLVRMGGDYEITATGAVRFDKPLSATDLIVGTYTYGDTAVKFRPDGTLQFASGTSGTWKLFDEDTQLYTITFEDNRLSLKLIPGRGLVEASDPSAIVFKRNR